ncbi:MAG TPA: hypothetical protein PLG50_10600 [bacterium]|nr:hypothetical protein [bacterium]HQG46096.1 hypothetical protein [bacterium]HQI48383.1 hypothetical protein [bacterium]HQJ63744.1 hypothetical protein [bacterium]
MKISRYSTRTLLVIVLAQTAAFAAHHAANGRTTSALIVSIPPDHTEMRDINCYALSQEMIPGWNLGNSLEVTTIPYTLLRPGTFLSPPGSVLASYIGKGNPDELP